MGAEVPQMGNIFLAVAEKKWPMGVKNVVDYIYFAKRCFWEQIIYHELYIW